MTKDEIKFRLLIKEHKITKLKYLCQTSRENFEAYTGSGKYWKRHLNKHGKDFKTIVVGEYNARNDLKDAGIYYSKLWEVVESDEWANLIEEQGTGGNTSMSQGYKEGMLKRRSYAGENNPNYGNTGELNPKFGLKTGPNPKLAASIKKNWENNTLRKKLAGERASGAKNTAAKKCTVDNIKFGCLKEAAIYFGYIKAAANHNYYKLRKNHEVIIL